MRIKTDQSKWGIMCPKYSMLNDWEKPSLGAYKESKMMFLESANWTRWALGAIQMRISNRSANYVQKHNYNNSSIWVIPPVMTLVLLVYWWKLEIKLLLDSFELSTWGYAPRVCNQLAKLALNCITSIINVLGLSLYLEPPLPTSTVIGDSSE